MNGTTIGALIGGAALAMHEVGLPYLAATVPQQEDAIRAEVPGGIEIGRGERFAVHRGVAYVPVRGVLSANSAALERIMGWTTYHGLAETMATIGSSDEVRGVVMFLDTPGGAVMGIQGAVQAIQACAALKPVHAVVHPLAASAGYWLASACTEIVLTPGSWVGSIGAMVSGSQPIQPGASGYQDFVLTSQNAGAKRPDLSTDEGRAVQQARIDAMAAEFLDAVAEGRGIAPEDLPARLSRSDNVANGGDVFWGADAVDRGLADRLETLDSFLARVADLYAPKAPARAGFRTRAIAAMARASL